MKRSCIGGKSWISHLTISKSLWRPLRTVEMLETTFSWGRAGSDEHSKSQKADHFLTWMLPWQEQGQWRGSSKGPDSGARKPRSRPAIVDETISNTEQSFWIFGSHHIRCRHQQHGVQLFDELEAMDRRCSNCIPPRNARCFRTWWKTIPSSTPRSVDRIGTSVQVKIIRDHREYVRFVKRTCDMVPWSDITTAEDGFSHSLFWQDALLFPWSQEWAVSMCSFGLSCRRFSPHLQRELSLWWVAELLQVGQPSTCWSGEGLDLQGQRAHS